MALVGIEAQCHNQVAHTSFPRHRRALYIVQPNQIAIDQSLRPTRSMRDNLDVANTRANLRPRVIGNLDILSIGNRQLIRLDDDRRFWDQKAFVKDGEKILRTP